MRPLLAFLCILLSLVFAKPRMAIVIDDLGQSLKDCEYFASLPVSVNCAVMPGMRNSKKCAELVLRKEQTLLIHFPWENLGKNAIKQYPIRLTSNMSSAEMRKMFTRAIESVPGAHGINNHMGSVLSQNPQAIKKIMTIMSKLPQQKFFLDSHTSRKTQAFDHAYAYGIPAALNNAFLDGKQDEAYIQNQFAYAVRHAEKYGSVIAICHGNRQVTKRVLEKCISLYNDRVEFVSLTELVKTIKE